VFGYGKWVERIASKSLNLEDEKKGRRRGLSVGGEEAATLRSGKF